eukprot:1418325-Prorocentrum_lima.AAC.1
MCGGECGVCVGARAGGWRARSCFVCPLRGSGGVWRGLAQGARQCSTEGEGAGAERGGGCWEGSGAGGS